MIAADTSSIIAYLNGEPGEDVDALQQAFHDQMVFLPPPVLAELLSIPELDPVVAESLVDLPLLEILPGFWERVAVLRKELVVRRVSSRLSDALVAQSCVDHEVALITREVGFREFALVGQLNLRCLV